MNQVVKEFIVYSLKEISLLKNVKISSYPKVILTQDDNKTETLAYFNPNNSEIVVYTKGRIYADIFRSLSHELVHYVQMLNNELTFNSGDTGTAIENEANSLAGIVLRNYTKLHPDVIKQPYLMIEPNQEIPTLQGIYTPFVDKIKNALDKHRENSNEGCLMLKLSIPYWENLLQQIDENDLYIDNESRNKKGLEREPHTTVFYGLSDNIDKLKLINSIKTIKNEIEVKLTEVNLFENEKFDVVKFKVESPTLHKLHSFVKENFENTESYPTYEPHVTIAYVKKGCGQKYIKQLDEPLIYSSKTFKYSDDKDSVVFNVSTYLKLNEYSQGVVNRLTKQYKTEFPNLTDEQILYYINRFDQLKSSPKVTEKDILKYKSFRDLEQVVDAFPTKEKVKKDELNNVEFSNTELIYNNVPLQIYHGDSPKSCIKIKGDFPATWCIARSSGGNMYHNYRFGDNEPSFYFVKNLKRMNKINELKDDKYCFFVVQIDINGDYIVTSALNDGDESLSWNEVVKIEPLLNGKEKLFKHNPLSDGDRDLYDRFSDGLDVDEYADLTDVNKEKYISITHRLSYEQILTTPTNILVDYIKMGGDLPNQSTRLITNDPTLRKALRWTLIKRIIPELKKVSPNTSLQGLSRVQQSVLTANDIFNLFEVGKKSESSMLKYIEDVPDLLKIIDNDVLFKNYGWNPKIILDKFISVDLDESDLDKITELLKMFKLDKDTLVDFLRKLRVPKVAKELYRRVTSKEPLNECDCEDDEIEGLLEYLKTVKNFINEAEYQGRTVTLNKPTRGDVKKFKVYVKNSKGKVVKVNFGSKDYNIKKNNPNRKKSYCSRSKGIEGGGTDKTKANYWSRKMWKC